MRGITSTNGSAGMISRAAMKSAKLIISASDFGGLGQFTKRTTDAKKSILVFDRQRRKEIQQRLLSGGERQSARQNLGSINAKGAGKSFQLIRLETNIPPLDLRDIRDAHADLFGEPLGGHADAFPDLTDPVGKLPVWIGWRPSLLSHGDDFLRIGVSRLGRRWTNHLA
jgi:hypothetical protein